jgi:hypothetical protein
MASRLALSFFFIFVEIVGDKNGWADRRERRAHQVTKEREKRTGSVDRGNEQNQGRINGK